LPSPNASRSQVNEGPLEVNTIPFKLKNCASAARRSEGELDEEAKVFRSTRIYKPFCFFSSKRAISGWCRRGEFKPGTLGTGPIEGGTDDQKLAANRGGSHRTLCGVLPAKLRCDVAGVQRSEEAGGSLPSIANSLM